MSPNPSLRTSFFTFWFENATVHNSPLRFLAQFVLNYYNILHQIHFPTILIHLPIVLVAFHWFCNRLFGVGCGEESVITFICHQQAGKNRGKKPLVTLVTNWAFLIKSGERTNK